MSNSKSKSKSKSEAERLQRLLFEKLFASSIIGDLDSVKRLVRIRADVNRGYPEHGATPLFVASAQGHIHLVRFLVKSNADINMASNNCGTSLYKASQNGH